MTDKLNTELREKHPSINFQNMAWEVIDDQLVMSFTYVLEPDLTFLHQVKITNVSPELLDTIPEDQLTAYAFNIGMIELFSYWKLAAPGQIVVDVAQMSGSQVEWWHKLLIKGMGEYFFINHLDFTQENFVSISVNELQQQPNWSASTALDDRKVLVPLGGGKDSALTLELLKGEFEVGALLVNPTQAARDISQISEISSDHIHYVEREFDPQLFELNAAGYMNGHVPVSASFAFISLLVGKLFNYSHVAISNERSSNEGNVEYLGHTINHQYSKTYEFERSFQEYASEFLPDNTPQYFSMLRPLYELQIAKLFTEHGDKYFAAFRSCNRGQRTNSWCGECSKCLFAFVILFPWLGGEKVEEIFSQNLFDKESLLPTALEMLDLAEQKPFECVGTHQETRLAFGLSMQKYLEKDQALPKLLEILREKHGIKPVEESSPEALAILDAFDDSHSLSEPFLVKIPQPGL